MSEADTQLTDVQKIAALRLALGACYELFSEIRNDWTDPRHECREGWRIIDAVMKATE